LILAQDDGLYWLKNEGGGEPFAAPALIGDCGHVSSVHVEDVDGDTIKDVVAVSSSDVCTYVSRVSGDVTGDGVFDSADLIAVLQHGQYEDSIARNSTFATGDWNGDQEFDSGDIIFVMQAGIYQGGPPPAANRATFAPQGTRQPIRRAERLLPDRWCTIAAAVPTTCRPGPVVDERVFVSTRLQNEHEVWEL
jgi:hypothetical protein